MEPELTKRPQGRRIRELVNQLEARDGSRCTLCGAPIDMRLPGTAKDGPTLEHRIPISAGGTNDLDNLALAHHVCNARRGRREPTQLGRQSRAW